MTPDQIAESLRATARSLHYEADTLDDLASALERLLPDPETVAEWFHEAYERLAPSFGYETRRESAVPWEGVPEANRRLMVAVVEAVLGR